MPLSPKTVEEQEAFYRENGYLILPDAISPDYLQVLQRAGDQLLRDFAGVGTIRNLLAISPVFETMIDGHGGFPLLERLIPELQMLAIDMRTCFPNSGNMQWHVDHPFFSESILTVNTALYLDDLTPDNGALRILPRSHRSPFSLSREELLETLPGEVLVECRAGTMVIFDDCLWHRTGQNVTEKPRRGIFTYYGHYWIKQCSYADNPVPFPFMKEFIEGKGSKRAQLMGLFREGSEYNYHPFPTETDR